MTWQAIDVILTYTLRWLVEVFIQDWKGHAGWGQMTKHTGEDGSRRAVILSLLFDHSLILHAQMTSSIKHKLVAYTVPSLCQRCRMEALLLNIKHILEMENPKEYLTKIIDNLDNIVPLKPSSKHLVGRDFEQFKKHIA